MTKFYLTILSACMFSHAYGQLPSITIKKNKGTIYILGGFTRGWFSKSDIHFNGKSYDFTLFDADATDSPDIPELSQWDVNPPQLSYRAGYFFKSENYIGVEVGLDKMKYRMIPDQALLMQGVISDTIVDTETKVTEEFASLEYPGGVNYLTISFVKGVPLLLTRSELHSVFFLLKPGGGIVFPRTKAQVFGVKRESDFQVAGYVLGLELSVRYIIAGAVFLEAGGKACFANYSNISMGEGSHVNHSFESVQALLSLGYQFHF